MNPLPTRKRINFLFTPRHLARNWPYAPRGKCQFRGFTKKLLCTRSSSQQRTAPDVVPSSRLTASNPFSFGRFSVRSFPRGHKVALASRPTRSDYYLRLPATFLKGSSAHTGNNDNNSNRTVFLEFTKIWLQGSAIVFCVFPSVKKRVKIKLPKIVVIVCSPGPEETDHGNGWQEGDAA